MNSSNSEFSDVEYDDGFDQYDVNPSMARAGGGGTNRPFHSGKGTRAKLAAAEKQVVRTHTKGDEKKSSSKSSKRK